MSLILIIFIILFGGLSFGSAPTVNEVTAPVPVAVETSYAFVPSQYDDVVWIDSLGPGDGEQTADTTSVGVTFSNVSDNDLAIVELTFSCFDPNGSVIGTMQPRYADVTAGSTTTDNTLVFRAAPCQSIEVTVTDIED